MHGPPWKNVVDTFSISNEQFFGEPFTQCSGPRKIQQVYLIHIIKFSEWLPKSELPIKN